MKRNVLIIMVLTILSQFFGFGRDLTLAYFYGASNISDVYLVSLTITSVLFGFIGKGILTGYIPLHSEIENKAGVYESEKFTNNLINLILVSCTIMLILGYIFTEEIIKVFASGFDKNALRLAITFTRISLVSIYFTGLIHIFKGYLQMKNNFIVTAAIGLPMNIIVVTSIVISYGTNVKILAVGFVLATFIQFLILIYFSYKQGYRYNLHLNLKDENIKRIVIIAIPVIIGTSVNQINKIVDRTIASQISVGGISALNYANTLNSFVLAVFVTSISTVMFPLLSRMVVKNNMLGLKKVLSEVLVIVTMIVLPATIGFMILSEPIVKLLFGRGAFDSNALSMTSYALFFYSVGLIGFALRDIISSVFYSLQDTKTPMINAAIAMILNIILNIILSKYLGIGGLALATSISAMFAALLLILSLRRKIGSFGFRSNQGSLIKIIIASILMGIIVKYIHSILFFELGFNLSLLISVILGVVLYILMILIMKVEEARRLLKQVVDKIINT